MALYSCTSFFSRCGGALFEDTLPGNLCQSCRKERAAEQRDAKRREQESRQQPAQWVNAAFQEMAANPAPSPFAPGER
jgi:hypothetical protein